MEVYKHNQEAYEKVMASYEAGNNKAAVVHATGTGKSYIIALVTQHFQRVLIVAPNNFVLNETKKVCHAGCEFRTYASVMYNEGDGGRYDLIVLDEFHRGGAEKWGIGIQNLINANPEARLLGTSATNIRYLDGQRNMADELFDGNVVSYLPLKEAISQGILPTPIYVSSIYSMDDTVAAYKKRIYSKHWATENRDDLCRHLEGIAHNWENAGGVPAIIRKYFSKDMQRVIVFCSKVKRAAEAREILGRWFGLAGFYRVRYYNIDYQEKRLEREMEDFQKPLGIYDLKVAISVNMLNEGVHIPRVDGIVMMRSTVSRIIIEQQVGRCLTSDNGTITPVVLDLVNNMDMIRYDGPFFGNPDDSASGDNRASGHHSFPFKVIDECRDLRVLLEQLDNELDNYTKEECAEEAKKYTRRTDFKVCSYRYYTRASRMGWLAEITAHMPEREISLTKEECETIANQYDCKKDFNKYDHSVYQYAYRKGWIDDICHYPELHTVDEFMEALKECPDLSSMNKKYPALVAYARRRKWPCLELLRKKKSVRGRTIESALTDARKYASYKEMREKNRILHIWFVNHKYIYRLKEVFGDEVGFCKSVAPELTYEHCKEVADQCATRTEMSRRYSREYRVCVENGWIDELKPAKVDVKSKRHEESMDKDSILDLARSYKSRTEFYNKHRHLYERAARMGLMEEIDKIFPITRAINYTREELTEIISRFSSLTEVNKYDRRIYPYIKRNGWEDLTEGLRKRNDRLNISKDEAIEITSRYTSLLAFKKAEPRVHAYIAKKPWFYEATANLKRQSSGHTYEECKEAAAKYSSIGEFDKAESKLCSYCRHRGWLYDFFDIDKRWKRKRRS